jgi:hypothetical protein
VGKSNLEKCSIGIIIERIAAAILDNLPSFPSYLHHECSLPNQMVTSDYTTLAEWSCEDGYKLEGESD